MKTLFRTLLPILAAFVGFAQAHPNGTSKVTVRALGTDSITVEIDANVSDMMNALTLPRFMTDMEPFDTTWARGYQNAAAAYMYSRLRVTADHRAFLHPAPLAWKRGGSGPGDDLARDSAALWDSVVVITFGGRLPEGARTLRVHTQLFPEFGIQTLSEVSVLVRDTLVERKWIGLDKVFAMPVARDSLEARIARVRERPQDAAGDDLLVRFIGLGFLHILPYGVDHILFVVGLFFFSTRMRPLLMQVTAFTAAHSITLGLSLLGIFSLPGRVVEPLIALSIAVVGLENVFFRKVRASRWLVVFAFGLVHGMGFAGVLSELGLPEGGFWPALIGFNLGVEIGQLAVIAGAFALTFAFRNRPWYFKGVVVPVSLAISAVGLFWAVQRVFGF
jgi:hydrogenase/urease accessory protein HupE